MIEKGKEAKAAEQLALGGGKDEAPKPHIAREQKVCHCNKFKLYLLVRFILCLVYNHLTYDVYVLRNRWTGNDGAKRK